MAGPAMNFAFSLIFLTGAYGAGLYPAGHSVRAILLFLAFINGWFAAFNLIPLGPLDGAKVLRWSKPVWAGCFGVFGALAAVLYFLVPLGALPGS